MRQIGRVNENKVVIKRHICLMLINVRVVSRVHVAELVREKLLRFSVRWLSVGHGELGQC